MENPIVFLLYAQDGFKIADTVKIRLEQNETTVHVADVLRINEVFPSSALVLFLTPEMLSLLKSPNAPDLKSVHQKSSTCALFFHDMINFAGDSVQQILKQKIPSYDKWNTYLLEKSVRSTVLQILNLVETVDVEIPDLVSDCKLYPDAVWEDKQTVFISFNSERTQDDKVTVDVDQTLFEATWVNPHTFMFTYKDCRDFAQHTVTVFVNGAYVGACKVLIKNRDHILLEEINDGNSPLHYLQDIMQTIKDTEVELQTVSNDSRILKGTRQLLKRLNQTVSIESSDHLKSGTEEKPTDEESAQPSRRQRAIRGVRNKLEDRSKRDADVPFKISKLRKRSQRFSNALQNLNKKEDFPHINLNLSLKKRLPADFFDFAKSLFKR